MRRSLRGFLIFIVLTGCTSQPVNTPRAQVSSEPLSAKDEPVLAPVSPPKNVIVFSGGGMYGAYSAGVLSGWTETGNRPEFDVVTGVSTGSLMGLAAFLGPNFDSVAREFYTVTKASDVYNFRAWVLVPWADSIATSRPLKKLINGVVDEQVLAAVAREHRRGRRLYVGTTHLESRKFVVWDMGAIAVHGGPDALDRFRAVLLASCSVPGVMPPVPIAMVRNGKTVTELHVDGGTTAALFVPQGLLAPRPDGTASGTEVYVVVAGKLFADPEKVRTRVLPVLSASANGLLYGSARGEIATIYHLSRLAGADFHLTAVPASDRANPDGLDFNPREMTRLYEVGYVHGVAGPEWMTAPPFESAATDPPRE
jgi:hypothetical protein